MVKNLNLELVILLKYQNIKTFLQKYMFQIGVFGTFYEQEFKKTIQKQFTIEKLYLNWRSHDSFFNS